MENLDLTEGKVLPKMIQFAIPIMLGDLFQQLYIAVDSMIVGQFAGETALAAVSATTFLIRLVIGLFVGISSGAGVVIAQGVGAKDKKRLEAAIHTMAALTFLGGIFLTIFGICVAKPLLFLVTTPKDIMSEAVIYLRVYFGGALFEMIYNVGSGILRAFGDSKRPFWYLLTSSVVNIVLDVMFIAGFHMGAAGAGLATVLAQGVSAGCIVIAMLTKDQPYRICINKIRIEKTLVPEILQMGLPAGLQSMIVALSNVLVQANINALGSAVVAGFGVFNKVDGVIMLPVSAIAMSAMTFTGQNYGAGKKRRIVKGIWTMVFLEVVSWGVGVLICLVAGEQIFYLFTDNAEIVYYAKLTMLYDIPLYWAMATAYAMTCVIRGMGRSRAASFIFVFTMCVLRQVWILIANGLGLGISGILASYPISWMFALAGSILYALYLKRIGEFR